MAAAIPESAGEVGSALFGTFLAAGEAPQENDEEQSHPARILLVKSQKPPAELNMDVALKLRIGCHVSTSHLTRPALSERITGSRAPR